MERVFPTEIVPAGRRGRSPRGSFATFLASLSLDALTRREVRWILSTVAYPWIVSDLMSDLLWNGLVGEETRARIGTDRRRQAGRLLIIPLMPPFEYTLPLFPD